MTKSKLDTSRWRIIAFTLVAALLYLVGGLLWLQIIRGEELTEAAAEKRLRWLPITPPRGVIFDHDGEVLVNNTSGFVVNFSYVNKKTNQEVIERLAPLLLDQYMKEEYKKLEQSAVTYQQFAEENRELLLQELQQAMAEIVANHPSYWRYIPIQIAPHQKTISRVPLDVVSQIEERRTELPNVVVDIEPQRQYKLGNMAFHVLGALHSSEGYGTWGIEKSYNDLLTGQEGARLVEVNAYGRPINVLGQRNPVPGSNLYLTIDKQLQLVAENALRNQMAKLREELIAEARRKGQPEPELDDLPYAGAVVVVDVNTGAIKAMASALEVDRSNLAYAWSEKNPLVAAGFAPALNYATSAYRAPGSCLKPITLIAAIENAVTDEQERFYCDGDYRGESNNWHERLGCWRVHGGPLNVSDGLKYSCNLVFYPLGERLGLDVLSQYQHQFGLGESTGLTDLAEGPGQYNVAYNTKEYQERLGSKPTPGTVVQSAIGQATVLASPLQIAMYTAMLANAEPDDSGDYIARRMRPYLVERAEGPDGTITYQGKPEVLNEVKIDRKALDLVREGMYRVAMEYGGTAYWVFHRYDPRTGRGKPILPVAVAGKTGTAQEYGYFSHGWFISYAPFDDPELAVVVMVEQGRSGSGAAAPVALEIYKEYFGVNEAKANTAKQQ